MATRILDYSYANLLPWESFCGDGEVRLRAGGLMVGFNVRGTAYESSTALDLSGAISRLASAFGYFGTGDMVHVQFHRVPVLNYPERRFPSIAGAMLDRERRATFASSRYWQTLVRLYVTTQDENVVESRIKGYFFGERDAVVSTFEQRRERFLQRVSNFTDMVGDQPHLTRLTSAEIQQDLLLTATGRYEPLTQPHRGALNEYIAQERFVGGTAPSIGEFNFRPVGIIDYPGKSEEQMLVPLLNDRGWMTVSLRFICQDYQVTRDRLIFERTHWVNRKRGGPADIIAEKFHMGSKSKDHRLEERQIDEINEAIAHASKIAFGETSITAIVRDKNEAAAELRAHDVVKQFGPLGFEARLETVNAIESILATLPGVGYHQPYNALLPADAIAEIIMPVDRWMGTPTVISPFYKDCPVPIMTGGHGGAPFALPSHIGGVSNQLILGPTSAGKSVLLASMVAATTAIPDVQIAWLDLDYSGFVTAHALGADYREMAADGSSPLCPLQHLEDADGSWCSDWFHRLFAHWDVILDPRQTDDLSRALRLAKTVGIRRMLEFRSLIQDSALRAILSHYCEGGMWRHVFDGEPASAGADGAFLKVFETRPLVSLGVRAANPATELILHGIESSMTGRPTFVFIDEAWRMLGDPVSAAWLYETLRTVRKKNGGLIMATQSILEIAESSMRLLLLEACPGKIYLPNAAVQGAYVREAYTKLGLNSRELDLIAGATPRAQYYFHSEAGRRLFSLDLGPAALRLCGATGYQHVNAARELLASLDSTDAGAFTAAWLGNEQPQQLRLAS